jgi:NaMN:DMB phosphoribosyltransferase
MSLAAIAVLIALIALADDRVRERMAGLSPHAVSHGVAEGTARAESATASARDLATQNGALALVVVAGAILFVCMLRT